MKFKTKILFSIALSALILSVSSTALAAGGGHGHGSASFSDIIPHWIHFIVYLVLLYFLLKKHARSYWVNRRDQIEDAVTKGERELAAANLKLEEAQKRVNGLPEDLEALRVNIKQDTENEIKALITEAKAQAERVIEQGKRSAEAEELSAERNLQNELAELVVKRAREILVQENSVDADKAYRSSALGSMKGLVQ